MTSHTLRRCARLCLLVLAISFAAAPALAQRGAMTVPRNLEQMVGSASDIVRGKVVSARIEKHPQLQHLDTLVITLQVSETIKGSARGTYSFRQYVWDLRDRQDTAGYRKGQEYVLLMNAQSRLGLTSPAGLDQGRFRVQKSADGKELAVNDRDNALLMRGMPDRLAKKGATLSAGSAELVVKHQKGPIAAADLVTLIRELVRQEG
jgi:hypothetical protein